MKRIRERMSNEVTISRSDGRGKINAKDPQCLLKHGYHGPPELLVTRKKKQDLFANIVKPNYQNTLPDVPCEPKHLLTSKNAGKADLPITEMQSFYEQLAGDNCGVTMNFVGSVFDWKPLENESMELDLKDLPLLEDGFVKENETMIKRSRTHKTNITWLRRTEYISSEPAKFKTLHGEKLEYRMDKAIGKKLKNGSKLEDFEYLKNRRARIKSIEDSFDVASSSPITEHHAKPGVYPEEVIPVFPDFMLWKHKFVEVVFDTTPSTSGNLGIINEAQMNDALLYAIADQEGDENIDRVGYFVPHHLANAKHSEDHALEKSDATYKDKRKYSLARDYVFKGDSNKHLSTVHDTYAFIEKDGMLTYSQIGTRINLNRSIKTDSHSSLRETTITASYRSPNEQDQEEWRQREETLFQTRP